ncbi:DegQ family serine endoprotease [Govanella unica]|uniref:DegQ family serine endoprotease n=1 Tax=Govanella unica TaxID=2975056 RepID=A0A9X3Z6F8_9PROT|nr:DegQ family serine endoprotease [Govania unica]MDA5193081.1 DegQ family serine endoprotease [Govania unica]
MGPTKLRMRLAGILLALLVTACGSEGESQTNKGSDKPPTGVATMPAPARAATPAKAAPESRTQVQMSFAPVVKQVSPAVVNIYTRKVIKTQASQLAPLFNDPMFRRFFGDGARSLPRERVERSLGSGVIVRPDGLIVTNNHVIGDADEITVALSDRREYEAKVILRDDSTDLAVLRINVGAEKLPYLELHDSDRLEVGDMVLALGNPFGVGQTVTSGIVSAVARTNVGATDYQFFIQTDAAINPGNSGGALVTLDGKLAGINTMIYSNSGGYMGIGFAIPSNMIGVVINAALGDGKIIRPWVGASGQSVSSDVARSLGLERPEGVLIDEIYPGSPAAQAGLKVGDIVTHVGSYEISTPQELRFRLRVSGSGNKMPVTFLRSGKVQKVMLELKAAPEVPARNVSMIEDDNFLFGLKVGNLSPAFAEELKLDPMLKGVVVLDMRRDSPALRYRLVQPGDVILAVNGDKVTTVETLKKALAKSPASFNYRIRREDQTLECARAQTGGLNCREVGLQ